MDTKTLIKLYQQGKKDFSGINLADADLSYAYLRGINLANACLTNANLVGTNLTSANLTSVNLSNASVMSAYLGEADLRGSDLTQANFSYAYLAETNLTGSYLLEANFSYTYLSKAILMKSNALQANFTKSNLSKANLIKADLSKANFQQAYLTKSNLSKANLHQANLSGANLISCQAFGTIFRNTDFTGACLEDWLINEQTVFENSNCDYIYLTYDWINDCFESRLPYSSRQNFQTGDFDYLQRLEKTRTVISLNFDDGIDWQVFLQSWDFFLSHLHTKKNNITLQIESIEKKRDNSLMIKIDVPASLDKIAVAQWFLNQYERLLAIKIQESAPTIEARKLLHATLHQNTDLTSLIKKMAMNNQ